ncbi:hypothetical protein NPIL_301821 [Nephila pilipes]|uniref:Uncharacterized protein n=1 Tax=Nephila pilipes TaxID=299642 RepID=A0A8X6PH35_NEPPI|nr:hypothetical protein NPIL_301821 [Nephila pilipes]
MSNLANLHLFRRGAPDFSSTGPLFPTSSGLSLLGNQPTSQPASRPASQQCGNMRGGGCRWVRAYIYQQHEYPGRGVWSKFTVLNRPSIIISPSICLMRLFRHSRKKGPLFNEISNMQTGQAIMTGWCQRWRADTSGTFRTLQMRSPDESWALLPILHG